MTFPNPGYRCFGQTRRGGELSPGYPGFGEIHIQGHEAHIAQCVTLRNTKITRKGIDPGERSSHHSDMDRPLKLQLFRKRQGVAQRVIAERLGVSVPQVSRWETGEDSIPSKRLSAIADAYGAPLSELVAHTDGILPLGPTLAVKGEVAAGIWREAFEWGQTEWLSFTGRPDLNGSLSDRFGLRVHGESMNLVYPHGSIVECLSLSAGGTITSGKRVIVVRENEAGEIEATVKEYVDRDGGAYLWPRSTHPDFQQPWPVNEAIPGITRLTIVATVVASIRPE